MVRTVRLRLTIHLVTFLLLKVSPSRADDFLVVGPNKPLIILPGEDALLPCHLSPAISAEDMTVNWYKGHFYNTVHVHRLGQDWSAEQMEGYKGRTSLNKDGVQVGNVSLIIRNVTSSDSGNYSCMLDAGSFYEETMVELKVAALGSRPQVYLEESHSGAVKIVCTSSGWYPEPEVLWKDDRGSSIKSSTEVHSSGSDIRFSIRTTYIINKYSKKFNCWIKNPMLSLWKESTIYISDTFFQDLSNCSTKRIMIAAFFTTLATCVIIFAVFLFNRQGIEELPTKVVALLEELDWRRARSYAAEVTLDPDTAHPWLVISEEGKSVKHGDILQNLPDIPERFDFSGSILGTPRLTSGRHYWEVEVGDKSGWSMGVYDDSVSRKGKLTVKPEGGYWLVQIKDGAYDAITEPLTPIVPRVPPMALGLFLDYEAGRLSVYNLQDRSHFFTYSGVSFPPVLRPFFNPGRIDRRRNAGPLRILPVTGWD
ncbi:butyrophilin subfamily 1 member A1-like [Pleurodeles waltl]|uniref:butyrophilin subfamily 1 member A1-like n=1 Tax=Pleurodeles waltl TaxID=8319 RepID=UPI0037097F1A